MNNDNPTRRPARGALRRLLTIEQAASVLGISAHAVRHALHRGRLTRAGYETRTAGRRRGATTVVLLDPADVRAYGLDKHERHLNARIREARG